MNEVMQRFTSRKFWMAVAAFATFVAARQYTEAFGVVLAFLGVEGAADVMERKRK